VDLMPYKFCTLPSRERVVERVLLSGTKWKDLQHRINEVLFSYYGLLSSFLCFKVATLKPQQSS
jgi:hypothetical protein